MIANVIKGADKVGALRLVKYLLHPKMESAHLAGLNKHYRRGERVASSYFEYTIGQLPGESIAESSMRVSDQLFKWNDGCRGDKDSPKSPFLHVIISWDPTDEIEPDKAVELTKEAIAAVMPGERFLACVCHADTKHLHCHVMVSTVNEDGQIFNPREDWRIWEEVMEEFEVVHGFRRVLKRKSASKESTERLPEGERKSRTEYQMDRRLKNSNCEIDVQQSDKNYLKNMIRTALNNPKTQDGFASALSEMMIDVQFNQASTGKITGVSYKYKGFCWKGSSLGKEFGWNRIKEKLADGLVNNAVSESNTEDAFCADNASLIGDCKSDIASENTLGRLKTVSGFSKMINDGSDPHRLAKFLFCDS